MNQAKMPLSSTLDTWVRMSRIKSQTSSTSKTSSRSTSQTIRPQYTRSKGSNIRSRVYKQPSRYMASNRRPDSHMSDSRTSELNHAHRNSLSERATSSSEAASSMRGVIDRQPLPIRFYRGEDPEPDHEGRTLDDILSWPNKDLERSHDYIQYLFPLPERSPYNPWAPLITREVFQAFRAEGEEGKILRSNLCKAFERMLAFYGFKLVRLNPSSLLSVDEQPSPKLKVMRADNCHDRFQEWVRPFDHNHLRITRIIRCLRVLGLEEEAAMFHEALVQLSQSQDYRRNISKKSLMFWERAATRKLWNPPEENEGDLGDGCEFLVERESR